MMSKKVRKELNAAIVLFIVFILFTAMAMNFDVAPIGPEGSEVGFSKLNSMVFNMLGEYNPAIYEITNIFGYIAIAVCVGFAFLGLTQLIKRKSFLKVDPDIYMLGGFYIIVMSFYALFEFFIVNFRPVILEEGLEASYPSSHTVLILCVMVTAAMQFETRIKNKAVKNAAQISALVLALVTFVGRLLSNAHWFTDVLGGFILSASLIMLYKTATDYLKELKD